MFNSMTIKRLKNAQFTNATKTIACTVTGWAFYVEGKGYLAFSHDRKFGILTPYMPYGGRKTLQIIIDNGGFITLDGMEFVNPAA